MQFLNWGHCFTREGLWAQFGNLVVGRPVYRHAVYPNDEGAHITERGSGPRWVVLEASIRTGIAAKGEGRIGFNSWDVEKAT